MSAESGIPGARHEVEADLETSQWGTRVPIKLLEEWATALLIRSGASTDAAELTAKYLVETNQRGLDSHGIILLRFYLPGLRNGTIKGEARPEILVDRPGLALIDGHCGLGAFVACQAMERCCEKARTAGAAIVTVRNTSHFGAASCYSLQAAREQCIGVALSNTDPVMAPLGALEPVLGSNPIAIAAPSRPPMPSLDIATSAVAQGKLTMASLAGSRIPCDWAMGRDGRPTDDPDTGLAGSLLPMAAHKGFGLGYMIDILTGCLSRGGISPLVPDILETDPQGISQTFIAINIEALGDSDEYCRLVDQLTEHVHNASRAVDCGTFMIPGELEHFISLERASVIPFNASTLKLLERLGAEFGVPFSSPNGTDSHGA